MFDEIWICINCTHEFTFSTNLKTLRQKRKYMGVTTCPNCKQLITEHDVIIKYKKSGGNENVKKYNYSEKNGSTLN